MKTVYLDIETAGLQDRFALDSRFGRIVAIGLMYEKDGKPVQTILAGPNELMILTSFRQILENEDWLGRADVCFVTYNGNGFDFPFIARRCARHRLPQNWVFAMQLKHVDLMEKMTYFFGRCPRLSNVAEALQVEHDNSLTGGQVPIWFKNKEMEKITEHLWDDLNTLKGICKKISEEGTDQMNDKLRKVLA